jgi:mRNA-degrading endonuclease RelE of RelBE toxin-antitoxin system
MPGAYQVEFLPAAAAHFDDLSPADQRLVVKQLEKLKRAPELGDPLGNKTPFQLAGLRKLYAAKKRLRIIYEVAEGQGVVTVVAIGPREASRVYAIADAEIRRRRLRRIS